MIQKLGFENLGLMDYQQAWDYQESLFNRCCMLKTHKRQRQPALYSLLNIPMFTRWAKVARPKTCSSMRLTCKARAAFYRINRGGDITYHGPGQLVGYPILNLDAFHIGVREYVFRLEEVVIQCLQQYNIHSGRLEGASGVWLDAEDKHSSRKICAIGVRASRGVTMHGFAFNINTDLEFYNHINPCGFTDRGVTSLQKETAAVQSMQLLHDRMRHAFESVFDVEFS